MRCSIVDVTYSYTLADSTLLCWLIQAVGTVLNHNQCHRYASRLQAFSKILRVMRCDEPVISPMNDQEWRIAVRDMVERTHGAQLRCGRVPCQERRPSRRATPVREIGRSPHIDHRLNATRLV